MWKTSARLMLKVNRGFKSMNRTQKFLRAACRVAKVKDESQTPETKGLACYRIRPITDPAREPQVVEVRTRSTASLTEPQSNRSPFSHVLTYEN